MMLNRWPWAFHVARRGYHMVRRRYTPAPDIVSRRRAVDYHPRVTAIVPNYNHARFLPQRLDSILHQTYDNIEILILDDASTDDSMTVIRAYEAAHPGRIRFIANDQNSGNVFRQWRRGIENATGDLLWICESDDFCESDFLHALLPAMANQSVMIGFGRVQFANADGTPRDGLDSYRERAEPGVWAGAVARPAHVWFSKAFGVANVIPNVGGCLIRRQPIADAIWREAESYRILGDWLLYLRLARGGQIEYEPAAVSYFRQHDANTSVLGGHTAVYYEEHQRIIEAIRACWGTPDATVQRFYEGVGAHFRHMERLGAKRDVVAALNTRKALAIRRDTPHILMVILAFRLGGGELFPIALANEIVRRGIMVSMLVLEDAEQDPAVRGQLDRAIPVYTGAQARYANPASFARDIGATLIHSHHVGGEFLFFTNGARDLVCPYVVTTHGSYEVTPLTRSLLRLFRANVTIWVWLTPRNLDRLEQGRLGPVHSRRIPNGMPIDERPFPQSRAALGIPEDAFVFAVVSRAIPEKGWRQAIEALHAARSHVARPLCIVFAGSGPEADALREIHRDDPTVRILGFQTHIHGLYRLADCALLPTRFPGESFPLSIVQALQVGVPVVATDIGEIAAMLESDGVQAGIVVPGSGDDAVFVQNLASAMIAMTDPERRAAHARGAVILGKAFDMGTVTDAYLDCYAAAHERHQATTAAAA